MSTATQVARRKVAISFEKTSFCFTGTLAGLKRTVAKREVRARGGLSMNDVKVNLDYLVIGEKGSAFWKHGSYSRKIEKARQLPRGREARPQLITESEFMLALGEFAPQGSGDIHSKMFVANYTFRVASDGTIDAERLQSWLVDFRKTKAMYVEDRMYDFGAYHDLFGSEEHERSTGTLVQVRFVKQMNLDESPGGLAEEKVNGARRKGLMYPLSGSSIKIAQWVALLNWGSKSQVNSMKMRTL